MQSRLMHVHREIAENNGKLGFFSPARQAARDLLSLWPNIGS
jgi:hypothetical protein